ncbi:TonB-dependent siderophore receptor [Methylomonas sp. BW4-1]|uniref:TonB-dependent siderophore receptor n=1 Tax=Methylomonas sp. BW4-1 TaxID=3376685 RepID=UPI00404168F4
MLAFNQPSNQETYGTNLDLLGKFHLFGTEHEILIGGDFNHTSLKEWNYKPDFSGVLLPSINIYNPQYGQIDQSLIDNLSRKASFLRNEDWFGVYFQDQITLWNKLHIMGGGRYDWAQRGTGFGVTTTLPSSIDLAKSDYSNLENQKFSPRVGILYQAFDWLSIYGNYTESLGGQNGGRSRSGQQFDAETGEQFEAGFKAELFDKRLSSTIAYYHLVKGNLLTSDPTDTSNTYQIAVGEARSQGIEVDIKGQITEQLNMVATYAYTDNRITKDNSGFVNNRLVNIPEHQASLWGTYQLTPHFKFGMGGIAVGSREGDFANTFQLPGYVRMDAMAAYSMPVGKTRLTAQINIHNLLDKEYFAGSSNSLSVIPGEPLSAMGLLKLEY